jgi:hypothetical protein
MLLLINQVIVVVLQHVVCLGSLAKLLVHEHILPCERLDVFGQLLDFLGPHIYYLAQLIHLLLEDFDLVSEHLYLILSFKQASLEVVLLP